MQFAFFFQNKFHNLIFDKPQPRQFLPNNNFLLHFPKFYLFGLHVPLLVLLMSFSNSRFDLFGDNNVARHGTNIVTYLY